MRTLVVSDGNCGEYAEEYHNWLIENLPLDIELEWRENEAGFNDGLFYADGSMATDDDYWWKQFCNSGMEDSE